MSDDPTADFLAREKALLGDDADLFASGEIPGVGSGSGEGASANQGMDAFPDLDDGKSSLGLRRVSSSTTPLSYLAPCLLASLPAYSVDAKRHSGLHITTAFPILIHNAPLEPPLAGLALILPSSGQAC